MIQILLFILICSLYMFIWMFVFLRNPNILILINVSLKIILIHKRNFYCIHVLYSYISIEHAIYIFCVTVISYSDRISSVRFILFQ